MLILGYNYSYYDLWYNCVYSYSLHFTNFTEAEWRGQCYGRNTWEHADELEENVGSGIKRPCASGK